LKAYHKKKQAQKWASQEEQSGDFFKAHDEKLPKPSPKEDPSRSPSKNGKQGKSARDFPRDDGSTSYVREKNLLRILRQQNLSVGG
jgi:hypothetical protein